MEYNVGQIVYLLNPKSLTIIPALVVEEVVRKTMSEQTKQFIIELPGERKKSRMYINDVKLVIFNDIDKLREHMLDNTRKSVEQLINNVIEKKDIFFGSGSIESDDITKKEEVLVSNKNNIKHVQKDVENVIINSNNNLTKEEK